MSVKTGLVYEEPLSVQVARFLKEKGFQAANDSGVEIDSIVGISAVGILYKDPERKPKKYLWGLINGSEPPRIFLGVVYLETKPNNPNENQWNLKMWGKDYFEIVKKLGGDFAEKFKTKIILSVEGDKAREEYQPSNVETDSSY